MSYVEIAYFHLGTVLPAFLIGTYLMLNHKGTPKHKQLGKVYMALMLVTAVISMFMSAEVGPSLFGHFGFIHIISLVVIINVPIAYVAVRNGNIKLHRTNMISLYVGGLLIAGTFALLPGRLLNTLLLN